MNNHSIYKFYDLLQFIIIMTIIFCSIIFLIKTVPNVSKDVDNTLINDYLQYLSIVENLKNGETISFCIQKIKERPTVLRSVPCESYIDISTKEELIKAFNLNYNIDIEQLMAKNRN